MSVQKGRNTESKAVDYLLSIGHKVIKTNYKKNYAEIDLITECMNKIHFTEVKLWKSTDIHPLEIFSNTKIKKMQKTAEIFLADNVVYSGHFVSFCMIAIDGSGKISYFQDLF